MLLTGSDLARTVHPHTGAYVSWEALPLSTSCSVPRRRMFLYNTKHIRCRATAKTTCLPICRGGVLEAGISRAALSSHMCMGICALTCVPVYMRIRVDLACPHLICLAFILAQVLFNHRCIGQHSAYAPKGYSPTCSIPPR